MQKMNKSNMVIWVLIVIVVIAIMVYLTIMNNNKMPENNNGDQAMNTDNGMQAGDTNGEVQAGNTDGSNGIQSGNTTGSGVQAGNTSEGAQSGDIVTVNYTGKLADGTVFDSNVDPKFKHVQPFQFTLGAGQVIPGWDKGIVGMTVGEKKTLVISPEDAYGANGVPGAIPPNATLTFDVQVLSITPGTANTNQQ
jgi:FKBP-type peptidyl-prolyl cis-trans isomerase